MRRGRTYFASAVNRVRTRIASRWILMIVVSGTLRWVEVLRTWYDWYLKSELESAKESELAPDSAVATQLEFAWD